MTEFKKEIIIVLVVIFLISAAIFRQWIFFGKVPLAADLQVNFYEPWKSEKSPSDFKPLGFDDIRIFYPQKLFAVSELKSGRLPIWNPYEFSGNPLLANSQTAVFYPLSLAYFLLPPLSAWSLISFSIPLLSGLFMFLFLRKFTSFPAALFGGVAFALCGVINVRTQDGLSPGHSALWLPLALYGIETIKTNKKFGFLICLLSICFSILAGWFQFSSYVLGLTFLYSIFRKTPLKIVALLFLSAFLITAPHWLPAANALRFSPRSDSTQIDLAKHLMPIYHPVTLLVQDFFGHPSASNYFGRSEYKESILSVGLLPLIFAILAIFKNKDKKTKFFFAIGSLCLFLGLDFPGLAAVLSKIPVISIFLPDRIFLLTGFSLCVLSALGLDHFLAGSGRPVKAIRAILLVIAAILQIIIVGGLLIYVHEKILIHITNFSFFQMGLERYLLIILDSTRESLAILIATAIIFSLFFKKIISRKAFLVCLFFSLISFGIISSDRYLYFSDPNNVFPAHPLISFLQKQSADYSRFVSLGSARFTPNSLMYYKLYDVEGVDAMYPSWYGKLFGYVQSAGKSDSVQDRISAWFAPEINSPKDWESPYVINFFKLTGVKTIVLKKDYPIIPPKKDFKQVFSYRDWLVYEFINSAPKVSFVGSYKNFSDGRSVLETIFTPGFDPRQTVVLENSGQNFPVKNSVGWAKLIDYDPQSIEIESNSAGPGFVTVNDTYFPSWQAKIDGRSTKILKANYAFRAVFVPPGRHKIIMYPGYF